LRKAEFDGARLIFPGADRAAQRAAAVPVRRRLTSLTVSLLIGMFLVACTREVDPGVSGAPRTSQAMFFESDAYERFMGRWSRQLAAPLVAFATVQTGDNVLDVGSGTGALAAAVLAATSSGRIVGIDPASAYVDYARSRTQSERVTFEVGDAQQLRFRAAEFDKTLSLLVMNFIPDPAKALSEMIRVTRPGGVVAAAVWDYGEGMEMLRVFWDEAVALDPASDARDERHMPLCRSGELAALWRQHGLADVAETPISIEMTFMSFDDFWSPFLQRQGPAGAYVASLSEARQQMLRDRLRARLAPAADGPFRLTARAWAVKGVVAAR
jgi:SAM-dependent methyltransferase